MKKKILASLLALCMIVALIPVSAFAAFADADTVPSWATEAVDRWSSVGVLNGDGGNFLPNKYMNRAEFATMIDNLMGYKVKAANIFSDVPDGAWYADAVLKLLKAGVMYGSGKKANPTGLITREEAAVMLVRALKIKTTDGATTNFSDDSQIASWAKSSVAALAAKGWVNGVNGNNFAPKQYLTRAQAATMLGRIVTVYVNSNDETAEEEVNAGKIGNGIVIVAGKASVKFNAVTTTVPVIVAPKSEGATVEFDADSSATDVVVMGKGTTVTGEGNVDKVEVTKESTGGVTVETLDTDVTNKSQENVALPEGNTLAPGKTENTTPQVVAGLTPVDTAGTVAAENMPTIKAVLDGDTVTLTATNGKSVPEHQNASEGDGYWVGVAFKPITDEVNSFKYAYGDAALSSAYSLEPIDGNLNPNEGDDSFSEGVGFWFNLADGKEETIKLQWGKGTGTGFEAIGEAKTYTIDMTALKMASELTIQTLIAAHTSGENVQKSDIKSIQIGTGAEVIDSTQYDGLKVSGAAGDTVTITVKCTRCIAVCLMGANVVESDKSQLKVTATPFDKSEGGNGTATYTITVKMPAGDATLGIGVLAACENSTQSVSGLSACEANNTTLQGVINNSTGNGSGFAPVDEPTEVH